MEQAKPAAAWPFPAGVGGATEAAEPAAPATVLSATGFVTVPETTLPNGLVVPAFQVSQYHIAKDESGAPVVNPELSPWVEIDFAGAKAQCEAMGGQLIRETQALALGWNIFNVAENWSGGAVGEGTLRMGLHDDDDLDEAPTGTYELEKRGFKLSNGETVFDAAGLVYTWVFDDVQGDDAGLVAKAFAEDSPSIATAPYPSMQKGMGWRPRAGADWSGDALIRGGSWGSGSLAGVFGLNGDWPDLENGSVGFRCTKGL
jgi:hypothetical protein